MKTFKNTAAFMLVRAIVFSLCSCTPKSKNETAEKNDAETVCTTSAGTTALTEPNLPEQTTSQPEQTAALQEKNETQTTTTTTTAKRTTTKPSAVSKKTQNESAGKPAAITGVETAADGSKTIVYPSALKGSKKKYPVIAWANGTGCPTRLYKALLESLAGGGYIVIADSTVMSADGKMQIDSIDYILSKSKDSSSVFYNKADVESIGVCGHSQGGRSSVNAAQADPRIRCVVSIAGASNTDEAEGLAVPCLFLTGTNDLVVVSSIWCKPSYDAVSGRATYASLKGAVHTTCMFSPEKISGYSLDWFDAYLKNDPEAEKVFYDGGKLANDNNWKDFQNKN